ncbi:MAG: MBL fold metallo-hydrolase [Actinomycetota bacterium]|nr:MBL fold metallo-hydrolase [Actinomycetota bacterium]
MILETLVVGYLDTNCYVIEDESTKKAIVIDPAGDEEEILSLIKNRGLTVKYIIMTHGHWDHLLGVHKIARETKAKVCIHEADKFMLDEKDLTPTVPPFLLDEFPKEKLVVDIELLDGQVLSAGSVHANIIHTPGHSPGSVSIHIDDCIFTGDLLFKGSIGRTDLTGGSFETLINSVRTKIFCFDDEVKVYPGHGPSTTVGEERATNPFFTL